MVFSLRILTTLSIALIAACAPSRTPFSPGGPITVGMPAELSDRERAFVPEIDAALRREGLVPVNNGRGDLQLDFSMAAGPVSISTRIDLSEDDAVLFTGNGKAAGAPLIGRDNVARKSFDEAFAEFQSGLSRAAVNRGWSSSGAMNQSSEAFPEYDSPPVY